MGQYHKVVNLDKKQYLHPHRLGDGLKLGEFSRSWTAQALVMLLAVSNGRGGGDFHINNDPDNLIGSWGGDRIAVVGDYTDDNDFRTVDGEPPASDLYGLCCDPEEGDEEDAPPWPRFDDLSAKLRDLLAQAEGVVWIDRGGNCFVGIDFWRIEIPGLQHTHGGGPSGRLMSINGVDYDQDDVLVIVRAFYTPNPYRRDKIDWPTELAKLRQWDTRTNQYKTAAVQP